MAEVVLDETQVVPFVGEREAAGMAQRVGMDVGEADARRRRRDEVVHRLAEPTEGAP